MRGTPADPYFRHVRRVFNLGAVGTVSDAQLLDWFVSSRDDSAEAAFEELMIRHGPHGVRHLQPCAAGRARRSGRFSGGVSRAGKPSEINSPERLGRKLAVRGGPTRRRTSEKPSGTPPSD